MVLIVPRLRTPDDAPCGPHPITMTKKLAITFREWQVPVAVLRSLALAVALAAAAGCATSHDNVDIKSPEVKVAGSDQGASPMPKAPSGAELYAINCNRCHPERSAIERNALEWKTVMLHMRVRANLPAAHANAILQYLQANSGN
jgi:hypothetical protein